MVCPEHNERMVCSSTRYGDRWDCPRWGCDVMCWAGETSTPANQKTRDARHLTHERFDPLWQKHGYSRGYLYKGLAKHMGLPQEKTHIGMFTLEQCREAYRFCLAVERKEIDV